MANPSRPRHLQWGSVPKKVGLRIFFHCLNLGHALRPQGGREETLNFPSPGKYRTSPRGSVSSLLPAFPGERGVSRQHSGAYIIGHTKFFFSSSGDSHRFCIPQQTQSQPPYPLWVASRKDSTLFPLELYLFIFLRPNRELQACCSSPPPLSYITWSL